MRAAVLVVVTTLLMPLGTLLGAAPARADAAAAVRSANLSGEAGLMRVSSARTGHLELMFGAQAFGFFSPDFVVPDLVDANTYLGQQTSMSLGLFEILQLSIAARAAANVNNVAGVQASVGDVIPSFKVGYRFLPVAFAIGARATLPTSTRAAGFDLTNSSVAARGLFTLDLMENLEIPVRVHLNGGFTYQLGKTALANQQFFEQNPYFLDGPSGQLLALPTQQWFYDTVDVELGIEVPLPYVTPFVEATYITAVGVPAERGVGGAAYSPTGDAHIILTPGVRIKPAAGFAIDLGADVGLTGNGGGVVVDVATLVSGQPVNPLWMARLGVSHTFDMFGGAASSVGGGGGGPTGQLKGCVTDEGGAPVRAAVLEGPALVGARITTDDTGCYITPPLPLGAAELSVTAPGVPPGSIKADIKEGADNVADVKLAGRVKGAAAGAAGAAVRVQGYVTNREDEVVDADLDVTDSKGTRTAGKAAGGAFSLEAGPGRVWITAKADKYLASGIELVLDSTDSPRANIVLRPLPKKRAASVEKDRILLTARIPFEYKTPRLQSAAEFALDEVVDLLVRNPALRVRVDVYAEGLDTPAASQQLADERALIVAEYLAMHGIARTRLETKGTPGVDDKSRRVEVLIVP